MFSKVLLRGLFLFWFLGVYGFEVLGQLVVPEKVGSWTNISGFAISGKEDYMVFSIVVVGKEKLYESVCSNGVWSELKAIEAVNSYLGDPTVSLCNPFLSYDGKTLYFQANYSDSKGGYDIYYSTKTPDGWTAPVNMGSPVNTVANECYPSITPGNNVLIFSVSRIDDDFRKPKESGACHTIYKCVKTPRGDWSVPVPIHDAINRGCECSPAVAPDGKSLYFSSINPESYRDGFDLFFTREVFEESWLIPVSITQAKSKYNDINPRVVNGNLYFLNQWVTKGNSTGTIFRVALDSSMVPLPTVESKGMIVSQTDRSPVEATLTVFDPTTLRVLGSFMSDRNTGEYHLTLLDKSNYIVDVRKQGFSFASFMVDYRDEDKLFNPKVIEVFDSIQLDLAVYDKEIFKPLEANVVAESATSPTQTFQAKMVTPGLYRFSIPLGTNYVVKATANWFADSSFLFKLEGDVVFSKFSRELPLAPKKKPVDIRIFDSESSQALAGEVLITNLNRDETITFTAEDIKNGKVTAMLREGDSYEFTVRGAQGYSFFNEVVDLAKAETVAVEAELVSLKAKTSIRLNNINFGSNSADLTPESFPELERVITLIKDNPDITIEIAAHTDNVGSPRYNLVLSEKRALAVVTYLLENGIVASRLVPKGYGLQQPMVPNTTEANMALNRRVEFRILEVASSPNQTN